MNDSALCIDIELPAMRPGGLDMGRVEDMVKRYFSESAQVCIV